MRNKSSKAWWLKTTIHLFNVASSQLKVSWSRLGSEELLYYSVCFLCFSFDQWVSRACVFHRDSRVSREKKKKNKSVRACKAVLSCTVHMVQISSAQSLSCIRLFVTPWTTAYKASLSITNSWSLLKLMSIELVMPSNHLILCHPLLLLPSIFPSIRVFSNESILRIKWPKHWSVSFSISSSSEYSGLISFRLDWLDLLAVQGTLKSLLQHHSSKASILWCSASFIVQLSHPYMTTGKTIALTRWTFVATHYM